MSTRLPAADKLLADFLREAPSIVPLGARAIIVRAERCDLDVIRFIREMNEIYRAWPDGDSFLHKEEVELDEDTWDALLNAEIQHRVGLRPDACEPGEYESDLSPGSHASKPAGLLLVMAACEPLLGDLLVKLCRAKTDNREHSVVRGAWALVDWALQSRFRYRVSSYHPTPVNLWGGDRRLVHYGDMLWDRSRPDTSVTVYRMSGLGRLLKAAIEESLAPAADAASSKNNPRPETAKHGRRYTKQEILAAIHAARKDGSGDPAAVAAKLGCPEKTILRWAERDQEIKAALYAPVRVARSCE